MTIRHLKIFLAVAQTGKMSAAAEQLYLSQPTVSLAVRELEEYYQVRLFDRLSKHLYITPAGEALLPMARVAVKAFDELELAMKYRSENEHFRIGATITIGTRFLPDLVERLSEELPGLDIFSCIYNTQVIEEKLLNAELDIGIVEGEIVSPDLLVQPIINDYLVLVCAAGHPFAGKTDFCPQDLEGQSFVMREKGSGTRALFERYLEENQVSIRCCSEVPYPEAMKHAVLTNHCMAVISRCLVEDEIRSGKMHSFRNPQGTWDRTFKLVYHKDKFISKSIETVEKLLKFYAEHL